MSSLTIPQATEIIHDRWLAQWGSTTPTKFAGELTKLPEGTTDFAILGVLHEPRQNDGQATLGAIGVRRFDRQGRIEIMLWSLASKGRAGLDGLAHTARGIFEARRFSGVQCFDGTFHELGVDGKWLTGRIDVLFEYQEIK